MDGDKTWQETKDACKDAGDAKIAVPSGSDENTFLHDLALQYNGNMWIGVRENVSEELGALLKFGGPFKYLHFWTQIVSECQLSSLGTCDYFQKSNPGQWVYEQGSGDYTNWDGEDQPEA